MIEIVKYQENGLQKTELQKTIAVFSKPNALQEAEQILLETIKKSLLTCYFSLNQVVPDDINLTVLVNKVLDSILEKYTAIRADEIPTAFANGIRKEYGEYYGICLVSCEQFIEGYLKNPVRLEIAKQHYKSLEEKKEPTPSEKFTTAKGLCAKAYEQVKLNREIGLNALTVFEFLNLVQLIHPDYKKGIMPLALDAMVKEKETEALNCMDLMKRRAMKAQIELLRENIAADGISQEQYDACKRVAKRLILTNWLRDLITNETDFDALIESKREFYINK